jgi:hypothetical protein
MKLAPRIACISACAALAACDVAQTGGSGLLRFSYAEVERSLPVDFDTPVAVGLSATVLVSNAGVDEPVRVLSATSSDPEILEVRGVDFNFFSVRARNPGSVTLTVETDAGTDTIDLHAGVLGSVALYGPGFIVPESPTPLAVVGGRMALPVSLRDADDRRLIGSGELPIVLNADPQDACDAARNIGSGFIRPTFLAEGQVTLSPTAGDGLTLDVVAPSALTDLELRGLFLEAQGPDGAAPVAVATSIAAGQATAVVLRGLTDDARVVAGLEGVVTLTTDPAICTVSPNHRAGDGAFEVRGVSAGTCAITGTVAGTSGYAESWSITITP